MMTLLCPSCSKVIHRVPEVTEKVRQAGVNQTAQHCFEDHMLEPINALLEFAAVKAAEVGSENILEYIDIVCPGCGTHDVPDSQRYVKVPGSTRVRLCCSKTCYDKF